MNSAPYYSGYGAKPQVWVDLSPVLPHNESRNTLEDGTMRQDWTLREAVDYYRRQGAPGDQGMLVALLREVQ